MCTRKCTHKPDVETQIHKTELITYGAVYLAIFLAALFALSGCGRSLIGAQGPAGDVGAQGPVGPSGDQGERGSDGKDAVPVYAVQFCHDVAPTYPTVFPEYALCVGGKLYGTFNGNTQYQYLAVLPDGAYSSSGQGAACSFSISGCEVTY